MPYNKGDIFRCFNLKKLLTNWCDPCYVDSIQFKITSIDGNNYTLEATSYIGTWCTKPGASFTKDELDNFIYQGILKPLPRGLFRWGGGVVNKKSNKKTRVKKVNVNNKSRRKYKKEIKK